MLNKDAQWLLQEKYDGVESAAFYADVARVQTGEPLAYIIGHIPFLDCTIYLDSHPLIPRVETEFWVAQTIEDIKSTTPEVPRILDLCAGSGCIGVSVAKAIPNAQVWLAELQKEHLPTISKNLEANGISHTRYKVAQSDLFEHIDDTFDHILCNPPYIDPILNRTEISVRSYEPHEALYGGTNGMELIERIIIQAPTHLTSCGTLYIEHEPEQIAAIAKLGTENGFAVVTHTDQYKTPRYSVLRVAQ